MPETEEEKMGTGLEIAVIGMDGRFPGANTIDEFWENLKNGIESVGFFSDQQLAEAGIDPELLQNPNYVKANSHLQDTEYFDALFFGFNPKEAEIMDPQMRIFHEVAWKALEDAGYNPYSCKKLIGCYAGSSWNFYWEALSILSGEDDETGQFEARQLFDKDFLSTRIAYKLNLKGPAITVQTACSTSLVAIHLACQGLLSGECDLALAGGVSISGQKKSGYFYRDGMIFSSDGHCRTFDAKADGSIFGEGIGVVVLRRLAEAISTRDHIYAVIKGSCINNDGLARGGFTAPSAEGQAAVIRTALTSAEVEPESIGYIEAHGTATSLGDPIELEGLQLAFNTNKKQFCKLGTVKSNVGHLNIAAGVAGFIKTVLALKHRCIPPSLHFETPNPAIDFENSPFMVNTHLIEWKCNRYPLRAGVSSFGIGGTNAHIILEEAPIAQGTEHQAQGAWSQSRSGVSPPGQSQQYQLILLSAKTISALDRMTQNLVEHFKKNPGINLADTAYTLLVGRRTFEYRRALTCSKVREVIESLSSLESRKVHTFFSKEDTRNLVFMFSGLGSQYVNMGLELYQTQPLFRKEMDRCFKIVNPMLDTDVKEILYPRVSVPGSPLAASLEKINQTEIAQIVIFIFEYSLASLLIKWGITPHALIGYSFGEYTAACISGIFSLEDALKLIVRRGELIKKMPIGAMSSVPLTRQELTPFLNHQLSLAIDNGPSCIVAGSTESIETFEKQMKNKKVICMRVPVCHALHSKMMEPILMEYKNVVTQVILNPAKIPYISNVTGYWMTETDAIDPAYWSRHLRETVRFAEGINRLIKEKNSIFVEIGPGRDLNALLARHIEGQPGLNSLHLIKHPEQNISDNYFLLNQISHLWLWGVKIDGDKLYSKEKRDRVSLPTYSFERGFFPANGDPYEKGAEIFSRRTLPGKHTGIADLFYIPTWKRSILSSNQTRENLGLSRWLVFIDECGLGSRLADALRQKVKDVIIVRMGSKFHQLNSREYTINPQEDNDYQSLFNEILIKGRSPDCILHLWGVTNDENELGSQRYHKAQDLGYYSLINLAKAIGKKNFNDTLQILVVTNNMQEVIGMDQRYPEKSTVLGPVKVIPTEYPNISCRSVDVVYPSPGIEEEKLLEVLLEEVSAKSIELIAAYRGNHRWVQSFVPIRLEKSVEKTSRLKKEGVYLITGGLGDLGLVLAEYLAKTVHAKLILTGRSAFPLKDKWEKWLSRKDKDDMVSRRIRKILALERLGSEVMVFSADVTDKKQMQRVVRHTLEKFGRINGVIHAAGYPGGEIIQRITPEASARILAPKTSGTMVIHEVFKNINLDFVILFSSRSSIIGRVGQVAYCAANNFLDAFATYRFFHGDMYIVSINWEGWKNLGMSIITEDMFRKYTGKNLEGGITTNEGVEAFQIILGERVPQVVVTTSNLERMVEEATTYEAFSLIKEFEDSHISHSKTIYQRPKLEADYVAPGNNIQQTLADIWAQFFGFEQVGICDDFFELGGDSLKSMIMAARIHKELGIEIPIQEFFNHPTIESLAVCIADIAKKSDYVSIEPTEKKEYYVLSSAQKRLYILQQMEKGNRSYNQPHIMVLGGRVEKDRLSNTFMKLIQRHESLRTSFGMFKGEPFQKIHDKVGFETEYYDLQVPGVLIHGDRCKGEEEEESAAALISSFIRPFDLSKAPLFRVGLIKLDQDQHILMWDTHHIIVDGISNNILCQDFVFFYETKELPGLQFQYKDFSQWQNREKQKTSQKHQEEYWLKELAGELPFLNLPTDFARPIFLDYEGSRRTFELEKALIKKVNALAKREDTTLYMVLLTLFNILLSKLSGEEDIILGTPTAGRRHQEFQPVVGMFVNTLALRNYAPGGMTFRQFLKEVKAGILKALENQDYQFEDLVEQTTVNRDPGRNPIFDVMFVWQYTEKSEPLQEEVKIKPYEYKYQISRFDLTLFVFEADEELHFTFEYRTSLFEETTIERFITYFKNIITQVVKNDKKELWEVEIISKEEKKQLLFDFNDTTAEYPRDMIIYELFEKQVESTPHYAAVVHEDKHLTYTELSGKANQLARWVREKGVNSTSILGIMAEHSPELILGIVAILKAGGAYLPLAPGDPGERVKYILKNSGANLLITKPKFADRIETGCEVIDLYDDQLYTGDNKNLSGINTPSDLAYVIYTSGSTGKPKGVMIEHRSLVNYTWWAAKNYVRDEKVNFPLFTSISFDLSVTSIFTPLITGNAIIVFGGEGNMFLLDKIVEDHRIGVIKLTPSHLKLIRNKDIHPDRVSIKRFILGGEDLETQLALDINNNFGGNIEIYNEYGPTEASVGCMIYKFDQEKVYGQSIPIGIPADNTRIYILDKKQCPVPFGVLGELYIEGDSLARGYLGKQELTQEKFVKNPFLDGKKIYRTGDLARRLPDGNIEFCGRIDHQVKIRGFRIELAEIENQLRHHQDIEDAAVIDKEDEGKSYLCAYIVTKKEKMVSELREYLAHHLPEYMIPSSFVQVEKIPLTPNGKLDRKILGAYGKELATGVEFVAPRNDIEKTIANIWMEVLQLNQVGIHENFFDLGGTSFDLIKINAKFKEIFHEEEVVLQMFRYPTIGSFAQYLCREKNGMNVYEEAVQRTIPIGKIKKTRESQKSKRKGNTYANID